MKTSSPNYKWIVLLLVSVAYFLAQGTRLIYSAVLPQIKLDFAQQGITDAQMGLVSSAFTWVFGLVMPFAGLASDLFKRKWVLVTGSLMFAVGIFTSGFASGLGMLIICYGIINAIGQSLMPPCNSSLIGQYHTTTRGTAFSIYQTAIYLGIVVCSVASIYIATMGPGRWRYAFLLFGAIAIAWAFVTIIALKDEQDTNTVKPSLDSVKTAFKAFTSKPSALVMMAALGCFFFATYGFKTWSPIFIMRAFPDMDPTKATFHAVFWFYLGAFAGVTFAGRFSDVMKKKREAIRFEVELAGMALCIPFILLMSWAQSLPLMIAAIALFGFATGVYDSNMYAALFDVVDARYRAVATGIFVGGGCIIGAFGPMVMGLLNDVFSPRTSMASLAGFAVAGVIAILIARYKYFNKDKI